MRVELITKGLVMAREVERLAADKNVTEFKRMEVKR